VVCMVRAYASYSAVPKADISITIVDSNRTENDACYSSWSLVRPRNVLVGKE